MHIIRLDIDRKNSVEHLSVGPLGSGLNAVFAPVEAHGSEMARFVRSMLFRGYDSLHPSDEEFLQTVDGSLQWVDATGHVRLMSSAGGASYSPARYVHSPLHPSERPIHADDRSPLRGLGNLFWDDIEKDNRWDEVRGEILGMIFCSPVGSASPEKLWWAASRLGVHSAARSEPDEGYQRLKAEEKELLDRLRNAENVDHDRAWWSIERDRIAAELQQLHLLQDRSAPQPLESSAAYTALKERLASIQIELSRARAQLQDLILNESNAKSDFTKRDDHRIPFEKMTHSNGKPATARMDFATERQRLQLRIEHLLAELASVEHQLQNATQPYPSMVSSASPHWDDSQLKQQLLHAEEMLRRWDRRAQSHRRLAEVQSHLRTRSPYRKTSEGSLIPTAERILRELTAGAARQLPPWAIEASYLPYEDYYRDASMQASPSYRREYYDRQVPNASSRQRKLVDLAIRLAIAEAAVPRIGRIPMILDDSISGFRGEALEQILHVLSSFTRDGRQLVISTGDEYVARRVAGHGGTVSRVQEVMRYARPGYILDGHPALSGMNFFDHTPTHAVAETRPLRIFGVEDRNSELSEINRQLAGIANEQSYHSWWQPETSHRPYVSRHPAQAPGTSARRTYLQLESLVQEAPGVDATVQQRLNAIGIFRVGDLLKSNTHQLGLATRIDPAQLDHIQSVAELMCGSPQLSPFDAHVLVGCGIRRSSQLKEYSLTDLVDRVESFLASAPGQDLVRGASAFEVSRIHGWLSEMKRTANRRSVPSDRDRNWNRTPNVSNAGPRLVIPEALENDDHSDRRAATRASTRPAAAPSRRSERGASVHGATQWKFYLDVDSPVVDAPSIGPRMAERLSPLGVISVGDLIASQPAEIAAQLSDKNVTTETVTQWQQQALLVCRIPNLRGHDAQLLVGAGYFTAEQIAAADTSHVYDKVIRYASSKSGVRILRGTAAPDLDEVTNWVQWSQNCRAIRAA